MFGNPAELAGWFANGEPNGFLAETGINSVFMQIMNIPLDLEKLYTEAQEVYLKNGICTIQDGAVTAREFQQLKRLSQEGIFKADIAAYLVQEDDAHNVLINNINLLNKYEKHLKIGGYKLVLDGSPQGKTAWLSKPYTDGSCGFARMKNDDVYHYAKEAIDDGVQLLAHCNGDLASQQFLDSYEKAYKASNNAQKSKLRPVMIHCQTVRMDQLERFRLLNMIPSPSLPLSSPKISNKKSKNWRKIDDFLLTNSLQCDIIECRAIRAINGGILNVYRSIQE